MNDNSILSIRPDGCGFHYGFLPDDHRQINVRCGPIDLCWRAYVGGERVGDVFDTREEAERASVEWAKANPS